MLLVEFLERLFCLPSRCLGFTNFLMESFLFCHHLRLHTFDSGRNLALEGDRRSLLSTCQHLCCVFQLCFEPVSLGD